MPCGQHSAASCPSQRRPRRAATADHHLWASCQSPFLLTHSHKLPGPLAMLLADPLFGRCSHPSCCPFGGVALVHRFTQSRRHPEARGWMMQRYLSIRERSSKRVTRLHGICQVSLSMSFSLGPSCLPHFKHLPKSLLHRTLGAQTQTSNLFFTVCCLCPSNYSHSSDLPGTLLPLKCSHILCRNGC